MLTRKSRGATTIEKQCIVSKSRGATAPDPLNPPPLPTPLCNRYVCVCHSHMLTRLQHATASVSNSHCKDEMYIERDSEEREIKGIRVDNKNLERLDH